MSRRSPIAQSSQLDGRMTQLPVFKRLEGEPADLGTLHSVTTGRFRESEFH
jgi:hypothetical protein